MKSKKVERMERKVKKMASFAEITKLNSNSTKPNNNNNENADKNVLNTKRQSSEPNSAQKKPKLEGDDYLQLKKALKEHKKQVKLRPRFWLRDVGNFASLSVDLDNRIPLFMSDLQHLIMYSQIVQQSPYNPARWCQLDRPARLQSTCVLVVENISMYDFVSNESSFQYLSTKFKDKLEIINSNAYERDVIQDLLMVPLTGHQLNIYLGRYSTIKMAAKKSSEVFDIVQNIFHIERNKESTDFIEEDEKVEPPKSDKFPRTDLLMSGWQMVEENFPLPIIGLMERKYQGYVTSKDEYKMVTKNSPMFGIDCEMCKTTIGDLEVTRVSLVDEKHNVFYETFVKPHNRITDYLTRFSGITPQMMKGVTKRLSDVQEDLRKLLPPDAILVGQSLNSDLHALRMFHPYIIDTSIIYNLTGQRVRKSKLQHLAKQFLNEHIQESSSGHCSIEDSVASLKLVQHKLTQNIYYGDAVMSRTQSDFVSYQDMANSGYAKNLLRQIASFDKTAMVFSTKKTLDVYEQWTFKNPDKPHSNIKLVSGENDADVIDKMLSSMKSNNLNIGHIQCGDEDKAKSYSLLDETIRRICENAEFPSLHIVIFTGCKNPALSNGCAFLAVS
ncbi:RNA exonuclease 5 [Onthophagus taurus]|uniref:RNA exonuclease 5 n=1 Tax=Onthophagus taurus TaxID=166361 RepID=UPI000C20F1A3|nr:RNA exonuclease 5 [Onthophagus taurus]